MIKHMRMWRYYRYRPFFRENGADIAVGGYKLAIIIVGHDHGRTIRKVNNQWYINVGSLGCPSKDRNIARAGILTIGYMIKTLDEAIKYISELEAENKVLRAELEHYKSRKPSGRKKHDETWTASYNDEVKECSR